MAAKRTKKRTGGTKRKPGSAKKAGAPAAKGQREAAVGTEHGAKAAFIRAHPDQSVSEVAHLAKETGFDMTPQYVSTQRSKDKSKFLKAHPAPEAPEDLVAIALQEGVKITVEEVLASRSKSKKKASRSSKINSETTTEAQFLKLLKILGSERAEKLMQRYLAE